MKNSLFIFFVFLSSAFFGQENITVRDFLSPVFNSRQNTEGRWKNNYEHYSGAYEYDIPMKDLFSRKQRNQLFKMPRFYYSSSLAVYLSENQNYHVALELMVMENDKPVEKSFSYDGTYVVDDLGNVVLEGDHPFASAEVKINEIHARYDGKKYVSNRELLFRFNDEFNWISPKVRSASRCEGCKFNPGD